MTKAQKENQARFKKVQAEAKKLKAKNPRLAHTEAVKRAWAMILPKSGKKVGAVKKKPAAKAKTSVKRKASIAGVFKFAGYQFEDARQFDIYGNLSYVISDENGNKLFVINGDTKNINKYSELLGSYIRYNKGLTDKGLAMYKPKFKKFVTQLTKEIQDYNKGKKSSAKPAKSFVPAAAAKAPAVKIVEKKLSAKDKKLIEYWTGKKVVVKKPTAKKAAVKKQTGRTSIAIDRKIQAKPVGKRVSKSGNVYYEARANRSDKGRLLGVKKPAVSKHKDTQSHNVSIRVMSGVISKDYAIDKYHKELKLIQYIEDVIKANILETKFYPKGIEKNAMKRELLYLKKMLKEQKEHARELKKLI